MLQQQSQSHSVRKQLPRGPRIRVARPLRGRSLINGPIPGIELPLDGSLKLLERVFPVRFEFCKSTVLQSDIDASVSYR